MADISKSLNLGRAYIDQTVTVTITVKNTGFGNLYNLQVNDTPPAGFRLVSGASNASYSSLSPNETRILQYAIAPETTGSLTLPPARLRYMLPTGRAFTINSSTPYLEVVPVPPVTTTTTELPGFGMAVAGAGLAIALVWASRKQNK
jgi:uncharacterized repeat protein (TIGR01451 family)